MRWVRLKEIVLSGKFHYADGGSYRYVENFPARYMADLTNRPKLTRKLKVVAAAAMAQPALSPRKFWRSLAAKSSRSIRSWILRSRVTIRTRKTWRCCTPWPLKCARRGLMSAWF